MNRIFLQIHVHTFRSINRSLHPTVDICNESFCVFADFYASGMQDAEVTKSAVY